jgi:hypothetical protein
MLDLRNISRLQVPFSKGDKKTYVALSIHGFFLSSEVSKINSNLGNVTLYMKQREHVHNYCDLDIMQL